MKNLKIVVASLILAVGAISLSSFITKSFNSNAFAVKCIFFNVPAPDTNLKDVVGADRNLDIDILKTEANWTVLASNPPTAIQCADGQFLCAICFDDSQYTLAQALNIVATFYTANGVLPHNGDVDPSGNIVRTYRQATTANH